MSRDAFIISLTLLLAVLAKIVESAALPALMGPDLLVVLAGCVGWSCDLWNAVPAGFAIGLLEDVIIGRALGARSVSLALAAASASALRWFINPDSLSSKVIAAFFAATLADFSTWLILGLRGISIPGSHFIKAIWIPTALWSVLLMGPAETAIRKAAGFIGRYFPSSETKGRETVV